MKLTSFAIKSAASHELRNSPGTSMTNEARAVIAGRALAEVGGVWTDNSSDFGTKPLPQHELDRMDPCFATKSWNTAEGATDRNIASSEVPELLKKLNLHPMKGGRVEAAIASRRPSVLGWLKAEVDVIEENPAALSRNGARDFLS